MLLECCYSLHCCVHCVKVTAASYCDTAGSFTAFFCMSLCIMCCIKWPCTSWVSIKLTGNYKRNTLYSMPMPTSFHSGLHSVSALQAWHEVAFFLNLASTVNKTVCMNLWTVVHACECRHVSFFIYPVFCITLVSVVTAYVKRHSQTTLSQVDLSQQISLLDARSASRVWKSMLF